ncbi:MAG TPA: phosphoribosylglycinamide formyltransferase [Actinomycetes bacterium]|nr:phosphoribosylglycinamide formyltransferase [Actinomycetes bacterium]
MARARIVVLVSGSGTNLQALMDAGSDPEYPAEVVAVGADRSSIPALARAESAGIATFVLKLEEFSERADWDQAFADKVAEFAPDLVVSAGFMKLSGAAFLRQFGGRYINTHPALSPSFPGMHAPRDALEYGVSVTGCTIFVVDEGVDTGPIVAQAAVAVREDDTEKSLHERIKEHERALLVRAVADLVTRPYRVEGRKVVWS